MFFMSRAAATLVLDAIVVPVNNKRVFPLMAFYYYYSLDLDIDTDTPR